MVSSFGRSLDIANPPNPSSAAVRLVAGSGRVAGWPAGWDEAPPHSPPNGRAASRVRLFPGACATATVVRPPAPRPLPNPPNLRPFLRIEPGITSPQGRAEGRTDSPNSKCFYLARWQGRKRTNGPTDLYRKRCRRSSEHQIFRGSKDLGGAPFLQMSCFYSPSTTRYWADRATQKPNIFTRAQ